MEALACTASVVACTPREDGGFDVETDRTTLFPEGGGQRSDTGMMDGARISHCREENGTVLHKTDRPFAPGDTVHIEADAAVRRVHTQQHTGEHLLSFAYHHLFGAENIGFHMSADSATIDLDRMLTDAEIAQGEAYANELVWSDHAVRIFTVAAAALPGLPLRKKNEALTGDVRIVEIEGGEMCTCCGTHFTHTAPVGLIKVLEHARYKQGCRLTFVCGALALRHFEAENSMLRRTAARLSAKPAGVLEAVIHREAQLADLQAALRQKNAQLAALYAERLLAESTACAGFRLPACGGGSAGGNRPVPHGGGIAVRRGRCSRGSAQRGGDALSLCLHGGRALPGGLPNGGEAAVRIARGKGRRQRKSGAGQL